MPKFPLDAPIGRVIKALEALGFRIVRRREHIAMMRENEDAPRTPLAIPNHKTIKASTPRSICTQAAISRTEFLKGYEQS